jgi:ornithine cyclodeaminase/alanine dehydrogenase-like protein (mu-crystallin family)
MAIPVFSREAVLDAVSPHEAYAAVRDAFVAHHRGEWTMQPKVYVTNYPAGDFRAMPALGGGHALLKWVTSFPDNGALGLPTVTGLVVLSNADTGQLEAVFDAASVTALRTAAAGVLAVDVLARSDAASIAVIGAGVNGSETARLLVETGRAPYLWDIDRERRHFIANGLGAVVADSLEQALSCDAVITVTPGKSILFPSGSLRPGQHVSLMGADGPGKAEVAAQEVTRARVFCDDWEQASHGGELAAAVATDLVTREAVTQLGAVLAGDAEGRTSDDEITLFDSTGLAIQDLAVARAAFMKTPELQLPRIEL